MDERGYCKRAHITSYLIFHFKTDKAALEFICFWLPFLLTNGIPLLVTLVCIPVQIYHVKKSLSSPQNQANISAGANHVSITIILIGTLFLFCNCMSMICIFILEKVVIGEYNFVYSISVFTLPLVNAVGFPLVIIIRKASLRDRFKAYVLVPFVFLGRVYASVKARVQGYEEIEAVE